MKRGVLSILFSFLVIVVILFLYFVSAEGPATSSYEETYLVQDINGHVVELKKYNYLYHVGVCWNPEWGWFLVYDNKQGQRLYLDGVLQSETPQYEQKIDFEGCPKLGPPEHPLWGAWNYEHWSEEVTSFYQEGNILKIRFRNFGGKCYSENSDEFGNCWDAYDSVDVLTAPYPFPSITECVPGSGPCCTPSGLFASSEVVCSSGNVESEACGLGNCAGTRSRYLTQYCSGASSECNGVVQPVGEWSVCVGGNSPYPESCNGVDDDCDGEIDENTGRRCMNYDSCQMEQQCGWDQCQNPPYELCNGVDDNCNGAVDEGYGLGGVCYGGFSNCQTTGQIICAGDYSTRCSADPMLGNAEVCGDGFDNNCNGIIDDGCSCVNGQTQQCGVTDRGECTFGVATCLNSWWDCSGAVFPSEESCNGLDDDCDGLIDENYGLWCSEEGRLQCEARGYFWLMQTQRCCGNSDQEAPPWGNEVCDGKDNDCDGLIDENHACPVVCGDGTQEGQCSSIQPRRCVAVQSNNDPEYWYGYFQDDCQLCGCSDGKDCHQDGWCFFSDFVAPVIYSFDVDPYFASVGQQIHFRIALEDDSNIQLTALEQAYFDHFPTRQEILDFESWVPTNVVFYDDGLHDDGNPGDKIFGGAKTGGFGNGFYVFRVIARDIYSNQVVRVQQGNVLIVGLDPSDCIALQENGDPEQKMNVVFIAHGGPGEEEDGYMQDEMSNFIGIVSSSPTYMNSLGVLSEYSNKINYYYLSEPVDADCYNNPLSIGPFQISYIDCSNKLNALAAATQCSGFKQSIDKVAIVADVDWLPSTNLGNIMMLPGNNWMDGWSFAGGFGSSLGLFPIFFYIDTAQMPHLLDAGADIKRQCIMGSASYPTFMCPMNNRLSCKMRDDVPDAMNPLPEFQQYCTDDFPSDEAYIRDLLGRIP